ncbi:hypothetical protein H4R35_003314 [Dimargaris xerosporica]|nr:hypothetical protein H4R35_003314 [Dimargaris xerosporica]
MLHQPLACGALLGYHDGRVYHIHTACELKISPGTSSNEQGGSAMTGVAWDVNALTRRKEQMAQIFPQYEIVGWYGMGAEPTPDDKVLHQQIAAMLSSDTELLLLLLDPQQMAPGHETMPIQLWEAVAATDASPAAFISVPYVVESTKDERIATRQLVQGAHTDSTIPGAQTMQYLQEQQNAAQILQARLQTIQRYINSVQAGELPADPGILHQISGLCSNYPAATQSDQQTSTTTARATAHQISYLGTLSNAISQLDRLLRDTRVRESKTKVTDKPLGFDP